MYRANKKGIKKTRLQNIDYIQSVLHARVNILSALVYKNSISVDRRWRREKTRQWTAGRAQHLRKDKRRG
jgi:hypothetical protein